MGVSFKSRLGRHHSESRQIGLKIFPRAAPLQDEINKLMPIMAVPAPHAMIKEAMRLLGQPVRTLVKSPLPQLTQEQAVLVKNTLIDAGLLKD